MRVGSTQFEAFDKAKKLTLAELLASYDTAKPLIMSCHASPYGMVSALSHKTPSGNNRPTAFA